MRGLSNVVVGLALAIVVVSISTVAIGAVRGVAASLEGVRPHIVGKLYAVALRRGDLYAIYIINADHEDYEVDVYGYCGERLTLVIQRLTINRESCQRLATPCRPALITVWKGERLAANVMAMYVG